MKQVKSASLTKGEMKEIIGGTDSARMCPVCVQEAKIPQLNCVEWYCEIYYPPVDPPQM